MMLHSMGDAGIGWKIRNATGWDEDVTQRVQKLHERIEPFLCWRRRIFSTYLSDSTPSVLFSRSLSFTSGTQPFLYFDYSIDVIEIHVPFKDAMVRYLTLTYCNLLEIHQVVIVGT